MQITPLPSSPRDSFKIVPSVYILLFKENQILLSKRSNTGYEDGKYGLVSGHVEANETLREAAAREAVEEIGLALSVDNIEIALTMHRYSLSSTPPERLDFFMRINNWQGEPINMEPEKCSELQWFDIQRLPKNTILYIRQALIETTEGHDYCEYGWTER